jgi:hypothetical protein
MSNYTSAVVTEMQELGSFTYDSASNFAIEKGLSVRSVISKIKHLGLEYTPKPKTVSSAGPRVKKSDVVRDIAKQVGIALDKIEGLDKSDLRSLLNILDAINNLESQDG